MLGVRDQGFVLEVLELAQLGMLVRTDNQVVTSFVHVNPSVLRTVLDGRLLVEAMDLGSVEEEDWDDMADVLRRLGTVDVNEGTTRVEAVVPPGSPADVHRVLIDQRIVDFSPPPLTLEDVENAEASQAEDQQPAYGMSNPAWTRVSSPFMKGSQRGVRVVPSWGERL
jgi:hypothetical protein